MSFVCRYGHTHRTEKACVYCIAETTWSRKAELIAITPWEKAGTQRGWYEPGPYRDWFWSSITDKIIQRDKHYQYKGCMSDDNLEVHHIIPRRLDGTEHPENLITLCHEHHSIQPTHHYDSAPVILSDIELKSFRERLQEVKGIASRHPSQRTITSFLP